MKKGPQILLYSLLLVGILLFALGLHYYVPEIPPEVLNEKYNVKPSDYIEVNGMEVHYRQEGLASDTLPLVLLHGTFSSLYTWGSWTESLKDRHQIIRLDLPGFGLTGPHPKDDYRVETYMAFLQSFLAELKIKQCILVGNSLGGEIAWRYALDHPKQVKKLILIGAAAYPVAVESLPISELPLSYLWLRIPLFREWSVEFMGPQVIRNGLKYLYGNPDKVTDEMVELYFDMANREGNREAITERMESFERPSPIELIPSINTPTLILWGGKDRLIPVENAWKFHRDLPNSRISTFPQAGHMPMEEIPFKSVDSVEQFLSRSSTDIAQVEQR